MKKIAVASFIALGAMMACEENELAPVNSCLPEPSGEILNDVINFTLGSDFTEIDEAKVVASGIEYNILQKESSFKWLGLPEGSVPENLILKVGQETKTIEIDIAEDLFLIKGQAYILHYYRQGLEAEKYDLIQYSPCIDQMDVNE
jgi:hypothetical protein